MTNKVHSSSVSSEEFQRIKNRFCMTYGMYPSFVVVTPFRGYITNWGELPLNEIPTGELSIIDKYFLLIALGLHGIAPKNEFNRLALRMIISKKFDIDWKSSQVSDLSGIFATFYIFTKLMANPYWKNKVSSVLRVIANNLSSIAKDPLRKLVVDYYRYLLGDPENKIDYLGLVRDIHDVLMSPVDFKEKADEFFDIVYELLKPELDEPSKLKAKAQSFALSMGKPSGESRSKIWGRNWRTEQNMNLEGITPKQLAELAKINEKGAHELAKELDKKAETHIEKESEKEKDNESPGGKLPGFSDRLKMLQKLLSERRYLAAIRKVRIDEIISAVRDRPGKPQRLAMRGHTVWELGDREEDLDIEMSLENYGFLIPNKTTLKALYEPDSDGTKKGGIGHVEIIVDTSGSMNGPPLETAIDIAVALTESARKKDDSIALVTFSSGAWEGIPPSYDYDYVIDILLRLMADGGTNLRGAINVVDQHLQTTSENSAIFIITDSAVWDINREDVRSKLLEWSRRHVVYMIVTADELYDETEVSLRGSGVRLIKISPWVEGSWEIILSEYEKL